MLDMYWTIPVARWSYWSPGAGTPTLPFIEPMVRRRLSVLSKMALHVAHECAAGLSALRVVFASRHGELRRTTDILDSIASDQPVSPTAFSLSVLNAMTGVFGIARRDGSAATAMSAGAETLGYALLEAHAQWSADSSSPVLLVYADEPADARYGAVDDEVGAGALAILIDASATAGLRCRVATSKPDGAAHALEQVAGTRFAVQSDAVVHGLSGSGPAAWEGLGRRWQWNGEGAP
ncbi:beta-ketoacyl synthase chain length factor [Trinickia sp. EG282A]|uniref:beta-ketoacyl synthase chain length factor n=1 Tax=Trinickia sp. EG282A TaxID=3237013 RepID=UPI0034D26AB7